MKFFGEPNHLVTKEGKPFFSFDENGEFDLDAWGEKYKEKIAEELKRHFKFEETTDLFIEEGSPVDTKRVCKICNEEFDNLGEFLAHSKTHKKR